MFDVPEIIYARTLDCGVSVTITRHGDRWIPEVTSKNKCLSVTTSDEDHTTNILHATRWVLGNVDKVLMRDWLSVVGY